MKFSIQEEGHEKQIFLTFKEASSATGIPSKVILRVLKSVQPKYVRRTDKKVFWIKKEEKKPFIQVDGEDFFTAEEIQERFGLSRTVFFNQLQKKKTHFLDSQEKSHEVTWKSEKLTLFLSKLKEKDMLEKMAAEVTRKTPQDLFLKASTRPASILSWNLFCLIKFFFLSKENESRNNLNPRLHSRYPSEKIIRENLFLPDSLPQQ